MARFTAHTNANASTYAAAGKAVSGQAADIYGYARQFSPNYQKLHETAMKARSAERIKAEQAEAAVAIAGIKASSKMAQTHIGIQKDQKVEKYNKKTRKAGKIAAFAANAAQAFKPPKEPKAVAQYDYSGLKDSLLKQAAGYQAKADSINPQLDTSQSTAPTPKGGGSTSKPGGSAPKSSGGDMGMQYMNYLTGQGMTPNQAAAMVGNLKIETGNFQHMEELAPNRHGTRGYGHLQWTDETPGVGRRTNFENHVKNKGLKANSFEANAGFLMEELKGNSPGGWTSGSLDGLKGITDIAGASRYLESNFIRPSAGSTDKRIQAAHDTLAQWNNR